MGTNGKSIQTSFILPPPLVGTSSHILAKYWGSQTPTTSKSHLSISCFSNSLLMLLARQEMVKNHDKKNADREKIIIFPGRKEEKFQSELGKPNCLVQLSPIKVFCVYVKNLLLFFASSCPKICMYTLCVYKILMM